VKSVIRRAAHFNNPDQWRHKTVCTVCSSKLNILKWTTQWNLKYWVIVHLVQVTEKSAKIQNSYPRFTTE